MYLNTDTPVSHRNRSRNQLRFAVRTAEYRPTAVLPIVFAANEWGCVHKPNICPARTSFLGWDAPAGNPAVNTPSNAFAAKNDLSPRVSERSDSPQLLSAHRDPSLADNPIGPLLPPVSDYLIRELSDRRHFVSTLLMLQAGNL